MTDKKRRHRRSKKKKVGIGKILLSILLAALVLASLNRLLNENATSPNGDLEKFRLIALNAGKRLLRVALSNHFVQTSQVYLLKDHNNKWSLNGSLDFANTKISLPFHVELEQTCENTQSDTCWSLGKVIVDGQSYKNFFDALRVSKSNADIEQLSESTFLLSKENVKEKQQDKKIKSHFPLLKYKKNVNVSFRQEMGRKFVKKTPLKPYNVQGLSYFPKKLTQGVPFKLIRGVHPVIEVLINGNQKLNLLVDTGASRTWLPPKVFSQNPKLQEVNIDSLCLANGFCFENFSAISKQSNYTQRIKGNYNGLIGMDLLKETGLTLDYQKKLAFFAPYKSLAPRKKVIKSPFTIDSSGRPFAIMTIGNKVYTNIILDTGSSYTRITPAMQRISNLNRLPLYNEIAVSINDLKLTDVILVPEICLDSNICHKDILSQVGNWASFGGTFFRNYVVSFDFKKEEIYFSPIQASKHNDSLKRWGLQLNIKDPSSFAWITPDGPANQKGITHKMTIVMINNTRIEDLGYVNAQHLLDTSDGFQLTTINQTGEVETFSF